MGPSQSSTSSQHSRLCQYFCKSSIEICPSPQYIGTPREPSSVEASMPCEYTRLPELPKKFKTRSGNSPCRLHVLFRSRSEPTTSSHITVYGGLVLSATLYVNDAANLAVLSIFELRRREMAYLLSYPTILATALSTHAGFMPQNSAWYLASRVERDITFNRRPKEILERVGVYHGLQQVPYIPARISLERLRNILDGDEVKSSN